MASWPYNKLLIPRTDKRRPLNPRLRAATASSPYCQGLLDSKIENIFIATRKLVDFKPTSLFFKPTIELRHIAMSTETSLSL
jgi:hypothetical protein